LSLALGLDGGDEHGRGYGADGDASGFGSADSVEDVLLVAGGDDAAERGLRGAYDADSADELVRAAVDVDAVDDERDDLKGLRRASGGDGESGGDVFEVEAVGFALLLSLVDEHLAELFVANGLGGGDDEVALAAGGHVAGLGAAMAVAGGDAGDGKARHEEGLEDAVFDEVDAASLLAFVVVFVVAAEGGSVEVFEGGVVGDADEAGKDGLAEELGEGLALFVAALALAFKAVAEDLVEEDGGGASAKDGRAVEGLGDRGGAEIDGFFAMAVVLSMMVF
jgi:hypothetical protein